jgi:hypothetical protein
MQVRVSAPAHDYIAAHGGDVYVYFDSVRRTSWKVQRVRVTRPPDREFALHEHEGLRLWLDARFEPPPTLELRRMFRRFGPLEATGTGAGRTGGIDAGSVPSWPSHGHGGDGHGGGGHGGHGGH